MVLVHSSSIAHPPELCKIHVFVVGVGIGAAIKGFILHDLIVSVAGPQNPLAIPVGDLLMSKKCFGRIKIS